MNGWTSIIVGRQAAGGGTPYVIAGDSPSATNRWDKQDAVTPRSQPLKGLSDDCVVELPPHSAATLELRLG